MAIILLLSDILAYWLELQNKVLSVSHVSSNLVLLTYLLCKKNFSYLLWKIKLLKCAATEN